MNVRDLAPALTASADLFTHANSILNGNAATVNINITANRSGSIEIGLELVHRVASTTMDLFASSFKLPLSSTRRGLAQIIFAET